MAEQKGGHLGQVRHCPDQNEQENLGSQFQGPQREQRPHFSEEKGLPLLLKLQEHPTKEMQFFVTNYLKEYATDNVPVILKLESYFKTTLFYINTNRSTKTRVYSFLEQESKKYKEVALMSVRILISILGSKTITDRDYILDILLMITETYNDVEVPLTIKEI